MGLERVWMACVLGMVVWGGPVGLSGQVGLPNPTACRSGADQDGDQLSDDCEVALATAFVPELVSSERACNWTPSGLGGGYFFGVDWSAEEDTVRIAYLPAYFVDCGWSGAKCWIRWAGGCRGHAGDSELVALEIAWRDDGWVVEGVFLSAHCFDDGACRWYRDDALSRFAWTGEGTRSGPVVWVAEGKNANYPSAESCDRGHSFYDTCDANGSSFLFPIRAEGNIGSRSRPIGGDGCVSRPGGAGEAEDPSSEECFWSDVEFRGWNDPDRGGVTPYERYLVRVLAWD